MKKLIRNGVFETNSSSAHSVSVDMYNKQFVMDTIYPNQNGVVFIEGGEFGWDWFKSNDADFKASYAAQQFSNDDSKLDLLKEVIMEQTGATDVMFKTDGYVDHDSYGILEGGKEWLRNFIFNKNSWVFGGNDNERPDPTIYNVPEFKDGKMIVPEYKYELKVDGLDKTTKYINKPTEEELNDGIESIVGRSLLTKDGHFITDDSIHWQITRPRNFYEMSWRIEQDYSKNKILFVLENSYDEFKKIEESVDKKIDREKEKNYWKKRNKMISKEALKIPGLIKVVNFTINEI